MQTHDCDVLVIGSGPGGATTACLLAEAGRDVILLEEGAHLGLDSAPPYSIAETTQKYRNGGLTVALGRTMVTCIEGRCVGGGSEINAALCHWPMDQTLEGWSERFRIRDLSNRSLEPFRAEVERDLTVSSLRGPLDGASTILKAGAEALGWRSEEVQRFWQYPDSGDGPGQRQSMTETLVPRALAAGCRLLPDTRVIRLVLGGGEAREARAIHTPPGEPPEAIRVRFRHLFVCGGPIQTPLILRRSGLQDPIGQNLRMHPMIRLVACFDDPINDPTVGVPVQQVVAFKPEMTLGCSQAALPHLVMWLGGQGEALRERLANWQTMALFYVLVEGTTSGSVQNLPLLNEPLMRYPLNDTDRGRLSLALQRLIRLLFTAGAREIFHPYAGHPPLRRKLDANTLGDRIPHGKTAVSTIHLFGTCPMGEDASRCVVDSWGRMRALGNTWINDASILPDTTGVNPQATLLAVARRNVRHYLETV
ncbi:MAG: GMC family oxidoreductase [Deltaproteobacteria bacterium]|nr:GMC family oxidoreductase [Deltaproteobacteria bacterium]